MELTNSLFLFAGIQGCILGLILYFSKRHNRLANKFLATFILLFSLNIIRNLYTDTDLHPVLHYLYIITWSITIFLGPVFYLYVRSLTGNAHIRFNTSFKHFIVPLSYLIFLSYGFFNGIVTNEAVQKHKTILVLYTFFQLFIIVQLLTYLVLSLRIIWRYHKKLKDQYADIDKLKLNWLFQLTTAILIQYLFWVLFFDGDLLLLKKNVPSIIIFIFRALAAVFVYWIGYYSLLKPEIFIEFNQQQSSSKKTIVAPQEIEKYKKKLLKLLTEDKIYLDASLTIHQLAKKLKTNSKIASQVINTGFNKSFYDVINAYRIEEVKQNLLDPKYKNYTIEAIAFSSGFKSSTTFNRLFKRHTTLTPNQFKNNHLK